MSSTTFDTVIKRVLFFMVLVFFGYASWAQQIDAVGANYTGRTSYNAHTPNHSVYIFCASSKTSPTGSLQMTAPMGNEATFVWQRYSSESYSFLPHATQSNLLTSRISNLEDGCYRVTVSDGSTTSGPFYAWVLNNWIEASAEIPDSSSVCEYFKIDANYTYAPLEYYDLTSNDRISFRTGSPSFNFEWTANGEFASTFLDAVIEGPPAKDTPYKLTITDKLTGCTGQTTVQYISKVTEASFTFDPQSGEAVLPVQFTNTSLNFDSTYWYFYKEMDLIKREIEKLDEGESVDSVDFVLTIPQPNYEYEWSGKYAVRLKTVKVNSTGNCYSTYYMPRGTYIEVDTSFVDVPNAFSPNGDNVNEVFVIKTTSLKTINVQVLNRWGGVVHSYKSGNIRSNETTYQHAVWDGRVGNRIASPGVYYYVITAEGRDERKLKKHGFFHLLR